MKKALWISGFAGVCLAMVVVNLPGQDQSAPQKKTAPKAAAKNAQADVPARPAAVKRTRETIKMLDDIYKQTIVLVTDKYVHDEDDFPAGSAAVELFRRVSKSGFHQVRLLDVTGQPYEEANVAKTDFEKEGVKQLKAGKDFFEEVVMKEGKPYLQAITPVPVVMDKCIMCHPHYEDAKKGEPIGAISYELPIK